MYTQLSICTKHWNYILSLLPISLGCNIKYTPALEKKNVNALPRVGMNWKIHPLRKFAPRGLRDCPMAISRARRCKLLSVLLQYGGADVLEISPQVIGWVVLKVLNSIPPLSGKKNDNSYLCQGQQQSNREPHHLSSSWSVQTWWTEVEQDFQRRTQPQAKFRVVCLSARPPLRCRRGRFHWGSQALGTPSSAMCGPNLGFWACRHRSILHSYQLWL